MKLASMLDVFGSPHIINLDHVIRITDALIRPEEHDKHIATAESMVVLLLVRF